MYINAIFIENSINSNGIDNNFGAYRCTFWDFYLKRLHARIFIVKGHTCQLSDTRIHLNAMIFHCTYYHLVGVMRETAHFHSLKLFLKLYQSLHSSFAVLREDPRHPLQLPHSSVHHCCQLRTAGGSPFVLQDITRGVPRQKDVPGAALAVQIFQTS